MVMVKSLREHSNAYGDNPVKKQGVEYDLPENLLSSHVRTGLVEKAGKNADKAK